MWKLFRFLGKKWQNGPKQRRREVETVSSLKHIPSQFWKERENEGTPLLKLNLDTLPKQTHILYISLIAFDQQKLVDLQKVKFRQFLTLRAWCKKYWQPWVLVQIRCRPLRLPTGWLTEAFSVRTNSLTCKLMQAKRADAVGGSFGLVALEHLGFDHFGFVNWMRDLSL